MASLVEAVCLHIFAFHKIVKYVMLCHALIARISCVVILQEYVAEMQKPEADQRAVTVEVMKADIMAHVQCTRFADLPKRKLPPFELQIPVPLSVTQAESYRITLAKQYEQLGNHKAQRHSGQRASMLRSLCADICRVCDHPYTLEQFEPEADSQGHISDYLQVPIASSRPAMHTLFVFITLGLMMS